MLKNAALVLLALSSVAAANPYAPAKQVTLPANAQRTRDYGTGRNALIIPTYNQRQAPHTILVGNREYSRERFDQSHGGSGLVNMRYSETPDSSARAHQAAYNASLAQSKARSW